METSTTEDSLLGGRVRLLQPRRGYRVAVDAVLLAAATSAGRDETVLDLGSGVGAVGLCLGMRIPGCRIVCLELQPGLAELARRNVEANAMADRMQIVVHDIGTPLPPSFGPFDHVATNPPYLAAAVADPSPDPCKALATVESTADLRRWLKVATQALKPDGTLTLIHRRDRLDEIVDVLGALGWGDIAIKLLPPAARVLVRARRSSARRLHQSPSLILHREAGGYTEEAEAVLRHGAALSF